MVSLESAPGWANGFKGYGDSHLVLKGPYKGLIVAARAYAEAHGRFGVALIDQSPEEGKESCGESRRDAFLLLQDVCDYLVVHDYCHSMPIAIDPHLHGLNWKVLNDYHPPTLVASKTLPLPKVLL